MVNGRIRPADLLALPSKPGYARNVPSQKHSRAIIGKSSGGPENMAAIDTAFGDVALGNAGRLLFLVIPSERMMLKCFTANPKNPI